VSKNVTVLVTIPGMPASAAVLITIPGACGNVAVLVIIPVVYVSVAVLLNKEWSVWKCSCTCYNTWIV